MLTPEDKRWVEDLVNRRAIDGVDSKQSLEQIIKRVLGRDNLQAQLATLLKFRLVFGIVSATGTVTNAGTGDWVPTRNGVGSGDFTVDFTPDFADVPAAVGAVFNAATAAYVQHSTGNTTAAQARFRVFSDAGVALDAPFAFIALGLR